MSKRMMDAYTCGGGRCLHCGLPHVANIVVGEEGVDLEQIPLCYHCMWQLRNRLTRWLKAYKPRHREAKA